MQAEFSCKWNKLKQLLPPRSMFSTYSPEMMSRPSHVMLTLRRRMAEVVENGIGRLTAGRSDSLGVEAIGLWARIVEPAFVVLTLLDGMDVSLMVDLDLCLNNSRLRAKFVRIVEKGRRRHFVKKRFYE
jgi:hypothetical protein